MPTRVIVRRQLPQTFGLHLHLYPQKRIALVNRIDPNTPGFFSGIKVGDSILSINGISMAGMSSEQIVSLLSSATTAVIEYDSAPAPTALASGVVIDLVDDDEEEPYRPTPPRQAESAFSGIMRPHRYLLSVERSVGGGGYGGRTEVIDLISSDEEDDHVERLMAEPAAPLPTPRSQPSSQQPSQQSVINSPSSVLTSSIPVTGTKRSFSSLGEAQSSASAKRRKDKGVMIKEEFAPKGFGEANIADEVVEVAPEELQQENNHGASCSASAANPSGNGHAMNMDEDFEIVGGNMTAASEMPHQREACTKHPFRNYMSANTRASIPTSVNLTFCLNCYCYVCEVKASECQDWPMHCNATYKMPQWKELQRANNAPILRIMTAEQKALYNSTYKSLLSSFLASSTGNYEDDDEDEYYSDSYDSYDDEDDYPHYGYGRFERHDQDDRYKGQVDAVVKQLRELLAESISDNNKFMAVVPLIATCMEKTKSRFRKYLEPVIIECMVHPFCNTDVLNVLRNIANAREMETIGDYLIAVQAFYANPSSKSVIGQLSVLPGNCIPNLFCRMCSKMSAEAQSTLIGMLRDLSQSWAVLMVLTNQAGSLPNENLDAFKGILYALCKKKEFTFMSMTADFARQYVIASDVSEQALLKLAAVMVDLLSTSSAALPISVVAYVFQLMLDMCMTKESAENISFLTQLASSEEHICTIRTLQTEVLHYISAQLDDNANKLVMCFSLLWLLVVRIYSSVPVDSMTNFLVPDWKLAIALRLSSFLHQSSRLGDAHSAVLLDIAQVAGAKALVHRDYPASACTLPSELINELCRLPRIGIAANDPTLQKYNIYLREFNGDSLSQVIPDLVCTVQNRTMLLQTLLHPSKMNRVVGHYLPCEQLCKLLRTQVLAWQSQHEEAAKVQAIIKSMDTVKFLWKSLVISMYQTVVNMQETYHKLFDRDLPTIDPPLIALVSDQQFIQQHGIEAMCVLFSLQVLKSSLVNTRPFLVYTQMKKNIDAVVSIWKLSTVAPKALSYIFMLDNLPKLDSLCVLVECLYKDLVHVHITKQYPQLGSMPVEKFLLNMAKEDWAACKAVSFGGCSNIFQLLGQVSIEEMAWAKELIEENMQQVVPLVETAAQIYIKDLSSCEVIIYSCINKANNLAFECYTRFSLAFTLTNASSARSLLASRLITLQAEFNHDQQQLERIQTKINSILSELPVGKEGFNGRAESTLCLCAYLGRIDICMARYGLDEAMMQAQFGSDLDKILNKVFCFCPGLTLEKAVSQLLPILRNRKHHSNTYIQHIERSVKHIKVPGRHDCARREVIFYHYQNCATLQELLRAVNNDEIVVNHIYSYMKNLSAPKSWSEYVKILYMLLGDERFAQHLYNWQLSPDIFVGSAIIIYDTVVQLLPSLASKEKVLVFVVNLIFYSNVNLITQCNNLQDIKAAWLDTGSTGDNFPEDVNSRIFFSKTLLMLLKDPQGAANYIATLRHYDALYAQYKEKILQNFMNVDKLEQSVEFHYHLQEYGTLFAYMNSLAFSVDVGRSSAIRFESLSKAVILLTNILTQDIYLNKHNIPLNVVSNDSFIRLLFNFCAHVVGYFYGVDTHNNYNAMLHTPLVKLITKVKDLSGGVQFVEDYLTCAMTQLSSYAPRLLQGLPNETLNSLLWWVVLITI
ncbi:PDZ domain-containing protein [archaeon]|nr:MAG: PDZ domain-containing protein [archaeon]